MMSQVDNADNWVKDFDGWNRDKKAIDKKKYLLGMKKREIWYVSVGVNVGVEVDGKNHRFERPMLILKKINHKSAIVVPLTSTVKDEQKYVAYDFGGVKKAANIAQVRMIDSKRLRRRVGMMPVQDFDRIIAAFTAQFSE
jgi:mRNA interferase MazF